VDPLDPLALLGEQDKGDDGRQANVGIAGVVRHPPIVDKIVGVIAVVGHEAGQERGVGADTLQAIEALLEHGHIIGVLPVKGGHRRSRKGTNPTGRV